MKNNKGQALVEFIIILPIFLLLIISVIDFGNIISKKYSLENDLDVIYDMYKSKDFNGITKYVKDKNIEINYSNKEEFIVIELDKNVKISSPMMILIFGNTYNVSSTKSIYLNE